MALNRFTFHLKNKSLEWCFTAFLLCLPFELSRFIYEVPWGKGFINPFTSVFFGLKDFLLLLTGLLFMIAVKKKRIHLEIGHPIFFALMLAAILSTLLPLLFLEQVDWVFSCLQTIKLLELFLLYLFITSKVIRISRLLKIFTLFMALQGLLAFFQVIVQSDLGLQMLGEPTLSPDLPHLARFTWNSWTVIRGYGTFPHPNVLGGFLVIGLLTTLLLKSKSQVQKPILFSLQFLGLLATFSRSAELALTLALLTLAYWYLSQLKKTKNKLIAFGVFALFILEFAGLMLSRGFNIFKDQSFLERLEGYSHAWSLFVQHPMGVGFSQFTLFLDEVSKSPLMPWEYQPVHNIFLLTLTELGGLGFILLTAGILYVISTLYDKRKVLLTPFKFFQKRILLAMAASLLFIGLFDHYLITLEQGRLLGTFVFALISIFATTPLQVFPIRKAVDWSKNRADPG